MATTWRRFGERVTWGNVATLGGYMDNDTRMPDLGYVIGPRLRGGTSSGGSSSGGSSSGGSSSGGTSTQRTAPRITCPCCGRDTPCIISPTSYMDNDTPTSDLGYVIDDFQIGDSFDPNWYP